MLLLLLLFWRCAIKEKDFRSGKIKPVMTHARRSPALTSDRLTDRCTGGAAFDVVRHPALAQEGIINARIPLRKITVANFEIMQHCDDGSGVFNAKINSVIARGIKWLVTHKRTTMR